MSRAQREKGKAAEREVCTLLTAALGRQVTRNLGQERDSGADITLGPYAIQVKRQECIKLDTWWQQTCTDAGERIPVLVFRRSGQSWRVVLDLDEFIRLAREEVAPMVAAAERNIGASLVGHQS